MTDTTPVTPITDDDELLDAALFITLMLAAAADESASPVVYFEPENGEVVVYNNNEEGEKEYLSDAPGYMAERISTYIRKFANMESDPNADIENTRFAFKLGGEELHYLATFIKHPAGEQIVLTYEV